MPAPIIGGIGVFLGTSLNVTWWDGEVPRFDAADNPINPAATGSVPTDWPVVTVKMTEQGFARNWNFEDPYDDEGEILIQVWGTGRVQAEPVMDQIVGLFARVSNWGVNEIQLPVTADSSSLNPYYAISMLLERWASIQEENVRYAQGQLAYRCDMHYQCRIHGAVETD